MTELHVVWTGRFMNERHHVRHWLEPLSPNKHVDPLYDDYFGVRTVYWHPNVLGNSMNNVHRPFIEFHFHPRTLRNVTPYNKTSRF